MNKQNTEIVQSDVAADSLAQSSGIDKQIKTAKEFPRSIEKSLEDARSIALRTEEVADSCFFTLPRSGQSIRGPSVRLAEIMMYAWGNLRADAWPVDVKENFVVAAGMCIDLEKNTAVRMQTQRNIINSDGERYPEHMIRSTMNAAQSIAKRNAIFSVIPRAYVDEIYTQAMQTAWGKEKTIDQRIDKCLELFQNEYDLDKQDVFSMVDAKGRSDIGESELIDLRGIYNAIEEGQISVSEAVNPQSRSESSEEDEEWAKNTGSGKRKPMTGDQSGGNGNEKPSDAGESNDTGSEGNDTQDESESVELDPVSEMNLKPLIEQVKSGLREKSEVLAAELDGKQRKTLWRRLGEKVPEEILEDESDESESDEDSEPDQFERKNVALEDFEDMLDERDIDGGDVLAYLNRSDDWEVSHAIAEEEIPVEALEEILTDPDEFEIEMREWQIRSGEVSGSEKTEVQERLENLRQ
jgi:hypothetical protein